MNPEKKLELIAKLISRLDRTEVFDVLQILLNKVQQDEVRARAWPNVQPRPDPNNSYECATTLRLYNQQKLDEAQKINNPRAPLADLPRITVDTRYGVMSPYLGRECLIKWKDKEP